MIGEEHQQAEAGEQQHKRTAHSEAREGGGPVAAGHAHRVQPGGAVGEGGDEDAQDDLVGPVAQEVAQQPGRELRGRQLQCHYRQPQQQRDDRHHRARDSDQQITGIIGSALERQRGVHPDGDLRQQRADGQGGHHGERRHHPQRSPGVFGQCVTADHAQLLISRVSTQMAVIPGPHSDPVLSRRWSQPGMITGHGKMTQPASAADTPGRGQPEGNPAREDRQRVPGRRSILGSGPQLVGHRSCWARIHDRSGDLRLRVAAWGRQAAIWYSCVSPPRTCFRRIRCSARLISGGRV